MATAQKTTDKKKTTTEKAKMVSTSARLKTLYKRENYERTCSRSQT